MTPNLVLEGALVGSAKSPPFGLLEVFYRFPQPVKNSSYFLQVRITCKGDHLEQRQAI